MINSLFKVCNFSIVLRNQKTIELMTQEISIPGITIGSIPINWQGMVRKHPGDSVDYNMLTLTIVLDEDLKTFKEILNDLVLIHNPETNELDPIKCIFDCNLFLLSNKNNIQNTIIFKDCWVNSLGDIPLMHSSSEDEQITMTMDISYNYWTLI